MTLESRPAWLIRQENGVVSEARTRAFLVDRFWILERSVNIEGADFIVQRRLAHHSLLDRTPPRLGFIQAKFYANENTTQYVHREYIRDEKGEPRKEFFLVCHTGTEDSARSFLLSSEEVVQYFEETDVDHSKSGRFALSGPSVLDQRFEVVDRSSALDRIERSLRDADFYKNRSFLSWALPEPIDPRAPIMPMYEERINNWWGDIPSASNRLRKGAGHARFNLEEVLEKLREIENSSDPERALELAEEIDREWGESVTIGKRLYNEDFQRVVLHHKRRYAELSGAGLLSAHAALRRAATEYVISELAWRMPLDRDQVYVLFVRYDSETFLRVRCESRIEPVKAVWPTLSPGSIYSDIPDVLGILSMRPGLAEGYIAAGRYAYADLKDGKFVETSGQWSERIRDVVGSFIDKLLEGILEARFGE